MEQKLISILLTKIRCEISNLSVYFANFIVCYWCSVAQSCPALCDPMDSSMPGFPVLQHLPEFVQTHVHWVDDAIQPSHPLSPSSPLVLNLSQNQGLFQWVGSSHQLAKDWSFSISPSDDYSGLISFRIYWFDLLAVQGTLRVFSSTTGWKQQFFGAQPSL